MIYNTVNKNTEKKLFSLKYFHKYSKNRYFLCIYLKHLLKLNMIRARFKIGTQKYVKKSFYSQTMKLS